MNVAPTISAALDDLAGQEPDARAVLDHFISGSPIDATVAKRVLARAERITAEVYRRLGELNVAVDLNRESRDGQENGNVPCAVNLAVIAALQWEIKHLREERDLYLDAIYAAKRAAQPTEMLPSFEELVSNTTRKIDLSNL